MLKETPKNPLVMLYEMRTKWEVVEDSKINKETYKVVGEVLEDLDKVIETIETKKKTCCV